MFRKLMLLLLLFTGGLHQIVQAQNMLGQPQMEYSSKIPSVQSIQKVIDVPMNNFTGAASINIPVYTATSRTISMPISLQYTGGGGIKVEDNDGIVGLGWNLLAGGSITRKVRGNEDEGIRYRANETRFTQATIPNVYYKWESPRDSMATMGPRYGGYYSDGAYQDYVSIGDLKTEFTSHNQAITNGTIPTDAAVPFYYNGLIDTEPDVFYFDFGGYSGKFIFGHDKVPIMIPYSQDIKITTVFKQITDTSYDASGYPMYYKQHYFESFKISTPDAKDYYFGETIDSREETPYNYKPYSYSGWYLNRIIDRSSLDTVYINYGRSVKSIHYVKRLQKFAKPSEWECANVGGASAYQSNTTVEVSKIITSKEEINFYGDSIKVFDKASGIAYRKLQFDFEVSKSNKRRLKGFTDKDLITSQYSPYTFSYYEDGSYAGKYAQDYWGYYNGASNTKMMLGYGPSCTTAANRDPAWPAMQKDILISIVYPTGGKAIFEYEPHSANTGRNLSNAIVEGDAYSVGQGINFNLSSNLIGGVRIKRIKTYEPFSKDTTYKRFYYNKFGTGVSSGHLYIPPSLKMDCSDFVCSSPGNPSYYFSTHNMYIGSDIGQHVSYQNVTVQDEKNGVSNGYTEYEYYDDTNTDSCFYSDATSNTTNSGLTSSYDIYPSWQFKRLPENFLSGKEKEKRVYNSSGQLQVAEKFKYSSSVYGGYQTGIIINTIFKRDLCDVSIPTSAGNGYGSKYGLLFNGDSTGIVLDVMPAWNGIRPILPPPFSYYFMYRYTTAKIAVRLSRQITETYASPTNSSIDTTNYYYDNPDYVNQTSIVTKNSRGESLKQQTLYALDYNSVNSGDSTIYFMKKAFINVPIASFNYKGSNVFSGGYRQYKLKTRADSTVILPFEEFSLLSTASGVAPATLNIGSTYPQALNFPSGNFLKVATYKYNADNSISYVIKKGNEKISLLWDYNKSFVVAQTAGADSVDIAFTSFETANNGNWTVAGSARNTASSVTGKKSYVLSNGNITRSGLNASKLYIVSYWSSSTAATIASTTAVSGDLKNGWRYYEHKLPAAATSVTISGSVTIDELRLHPVGAQMTTYTFEPVTGMSSSTTPDNKSSYYEYDGKGALLFIRDADRNIIKTAQYYYTGFENDSAAWRDAGGIFRKKLCPSNPAYTGDTTEVKQIDINPNSASYGTYRWTYYSKSPGSAPPDWQNTATALRCAKNGSNENTGEQEREQKDMNPCSPTYNTLIWVSAGTNLTSCPLPPPPCSGNDRKIIGGVCVIGTKIYTASVWSPSEGKWSCKFHYEWPGCDKSIDYYEYKTSSCATASSCVPD